MKKLLILGIYGFLHFSLFQTINLPVNFFQGFCIRCPEIFTSCNLCNFCQTLIININLYRPVRLHSEQALGRIRGKPLCAGTDCVYLHAICL